jgi:CBS domain-containing protein
MQHRIEEVMHSAVVAVGESTTFHEITRLLDHHHISGVPVVDGSGRVLGVVSDVDLRKASQERGEAAAAELMHSPAITTMPTTSVAEAARLMREQHINRLPVVDHIDERLIGIVTRHDLLSVLYRADEDIRREILDEVILRECVMDPRRFKVEVEDGMVTLQGEVERRSIIPILVGLVQRMDGVVDVRNRLAFEFDDADPARLSTLMRALNGTR